MSKVIMLEILFLTYLVKYKDMVSNIAIIKKEYIILVSIIDKFLKLSIQLPKILGIQRDVIVDEIENIINWITLTLYVLRYLKRNNFIVFTIH